jgi:hypothetical protein
MPAAQCLKMISLTLAISVVVVFGAAAQRVPQGQGVVALGADVPTLDPHMHTVRGMLIVGWQLTEECLRTPPAMCSHREHGIRHLNAACAARERSRRPVLPTHGARAPSNVR